MYSLRVSIMYGLLGICLIALEFAIYYIFGRSRVPLLLGGALIVAVLILTGMAAYESIKHRNDKEQW